MANKARQFNQIQIVISIFIVSNGAATYASAQPSRRVASKPNVVLIIMDDMGYGDI